MPSVMSQFVVPAYVRATRMNRRYTTAAAAHEHVARRSLRPAEYGPPRRLRGDVSVSIANRDCWPVYTLTPTAAASRGGLVYAHGGGWVNEIVSQHWHLAAKIAAEARLTVTVPIYPLVPFGTSGPVVTRFADLVVASIAEHGPTALAGDSAGGQIALSAAQLLRDRDEVVLPHTVLISPALDLHFDNPDIPAIQPSDPWLAQPGAHVYIKHWRGELSLDNPLVSPLFGEFSGLGPMTVFSGTRDILNPDARLLAAKAKAAGVDIDYIDHDGLVHVYPLTPTPEGKAAQALIVERLRGASEPAR